MSFLDKTIIKRLFGIPRSVRLSDEDFYDRRGFVRGVILGSGRECKCYIRDFLPFQQRFKPAWARLYDRFRAQHAAGVKEWPEFGAEDTLCFFHYENGKDCEEIVPLADWQAGAAPAGPLVVE